MANNDYNYYKSEYSKFKNNYYTPGSNNNNNNNKDKGKAAKRFLRAFLVFLITFGVIAAAVFGGIKLYKNIADKKEKETTVATTVEEETSETKTETTTEEKTTEEKTTEPTTTAAPSDSKITAGTVGVVKTDDNSGIYLRHNPTYDEPGYAHLPDGTSVTISEISSDGKWGKSSNFDINGWVYLQYITASASAPASNSKPSSSADNSENLTFGQALTIFGNDTSKNLYMNCRINTSSVSGIADYSDPNSKVISTFAGGQDVEIYSVRSGYGKTRVNGIETWIPTQYLDFVSWGHYR